MHITNSTVHNFTWRDLMNEKIFKTISGAGALNLVLGIVAIVTGVAAGVLLLVNGAKLLKSKTDLMI